MSVSKEIPTMTSRWQTAIVAASLLAIAIHLVLRWLVKPYAVESIRVADIPLLIMILVGGTPLVLQILRKLLQGNLGADMLAALALVTAAWLEEYLASVLIILMLSGGQALEVFAMRRASSVLQALAKRMPSTAHRKVGNRIEDIPLANICIDDSIVIYPHETSPVDGTVLEGHGAMDESYLTGEPYRISKTPGSNVLSGAINGEAALVIRADRLASDSRYAQIMEVMQEAEQKRPNLRRLGDQFGAAFAPLALAAALAAWYVTGDEMRFLAVLVIATPCPLLIAIPITIISAISMAAKRGIIIRDPTALERLPTCRTAIFDKTGTLTYGQPELTDIVMAEGGNSDEILRYAAGVERYSKHPLAGAVVRAAEKAKMLLPEAINVAEKPGQGLAGMVENHQITITNRNKLLQSKPELGKILPPVTSGLECVVLQDDRYIATFRFRDTPRLEGKQFVTHLAPYHNFDKVMLVSGDREDEVKHLAKLLGISDARASQSPEQKLAIAREENAKSPTMFMGDGINDAPALAAATVGIAFGHNSNVTIEAAGAVIMESSLAKVDELIHISGSMRRIAMQSAMGGMLLSFIGMGFAAAGFITPVAGALLQEAIDIVAILNALRLTLSHKVEMDLPGEAEQKSKPGLHLPP